MSTGRFASWKIFVRGWKWNLWYLIRLLRSGTEPALQDWVISAFFLYGMWIGMTIAGDWEFVVFAVLMWILAIVSYLQFRKLKTISRMVYPPKVVSRHKMPMGRLSFFSGGPFSQPGKSMSYGTFSVQAPAYTSNPDPPPRHHLLVRIIGPVSNGGCWLGNGLLQ